MHNLLLCLSFLLMWFRYMASFLAYNFFFFLFYKSDMLPAFEAKDQKTVNNPVEAYIIAEVLLLFKYNNK